MNKAAILIGEPVQFGNICKIYPPKVKDVLANPKFPVYKSMLTTCQDDLAEQAQKVGKEDAETEPFKWLLNFVQEPQGLELIKEALEFFLHESVIILREQEVIIVGFTESDLEKISSLKDLRFLTQKNWFQFSNVIRESCGDLPIPEPLPEDPNEDPRIRRIKEKARLRDRIKARKGGGGGIPIETCITAIFCMGLGITPLNIGEMSYAAINPIMSMYQSKERYQIDIDCALAGSKKAKPVYWIRKQN